LKIGIIGLLVFVTFLSFGQKKKSKRKDGEVLNAATHIEQSVRFEIEVGLYDQTYDIINGEEDGVLLVRDTDEIDRQGNPKFELISLDTGLRVRWNKEYYINRWWRYRGYDYNNGAFYLLFRYEKGNSKDLKILELDLTTGDTTHFTIKNLVEIRLTEFEMTPGAAILGGYFSDNPVVIHYTLSTDKSIVLPGIYENKTDLVQILVEDKKETFVVVVSERTYDKRKTLSVKTYDFHGNLIGNSTLQPDIDKGLIYGRAAEISTDVNLVAGTYSRRKSQYSRGLFIASIDPQGKQKIKYYNYADLENFFNYMRAKKQVRIENRIERKKIKGKKMKFNYRLLVHDIIDHGDQYIMLGEAFYPKYNNSSYYAGPSRYAGQGTYGSYFAGYRYTHAVVIGFDKKGNVLWDNSFEIEDVLSPTLDQFVHVEIKGDDVVLLYLYEDEVRSKIIHESQVVEGKSFDPIKLTFDDDVLKDNYSEISGLESWYGSTFLAYGTQSIRNMKNSGVKLNRRVFYLNKINYK